MTTKKTIAQNAAPMTTRTTTKALQKVMDGKLAKGTVDGLDKAKKVATKPGRKEIVEAKVATKKVAAKPAKKVAATKKTAAKVDGAKYAGIKAGTKAEQLLDMVTAKEGATKAAMLKMLGGWKGCGNYLGINAKKAGLTIERRKVDGETRWFAKK